MILRVHIRPFWITVVESFSKKQGKQTELAEVFSHVETKENSTEIIHSPYPIVVCWTFPPLYIGRVHLLLKGY